MLNLIHDPLDISFGQYQQARGSDSQAGRTQLRLPGGLFARQIEHRALSLWRGFALFRQLIGDLQQQRGLSDSRLAADEHHRAGNDATAKDPVELRDSRWLARGFSFVNFSQRQRLAAMGEVAGLRRSACSLGSRIGVGALYSSRLSHVPQSGHLPIHLP